MTSKHSLDRQTVLGAVGDALAELVVADHVLLCLHAHELALVHRFGVYLEQGLQPELRRHELSVDLDYDRHGRLQKVLPARPDRDETKRFRPDLIIHRRMDDSDNLLVVEWKKRASERMLKLLHDRLQLLVGNDDQLHAYRYDVGVMVDSDNDFLRWSAYDRSGCVVSWRYVERR
jgi:hypothetical protein